MNTVIPVWKQTLIGGVVAGLSAFSALAQPQLPPPAAPAAGVYTIRAVGADLCIGWRPGGGLRLPFLATGHCGRKVEIRDDHSGTIIGAFLGIPIPTASTVVYPGESTFVVLPHAAGGYTIRSANEWPARGLERQNTANRLLSCVTMARGVVFGPPGVDVLACDQPAGAGGYGSIGTTDQRFEILPVGKGPPNRYHLLVNGGGRPQRCVEVRGASREVDTDLGVADCTGAENQVFEFNYSGSPAPWRDDLASAQALGWTDQGKGGMLSAVPVGGVNLMGGDIGGDASVNDQGQACAVMCVQNSECRAFTWVRPGVQGPTAMCWLKGPSYSPANADANTASGLVRP